MNLAHKGVGSIVTTLLTGAALAAHANAAELGYTIRPAQGQFNFVDTNVRNDPSVNITIACWLARQSDCAHGAPPPASAVISSSTTPQYVLIPPVDAPSARTQAQPAQIPPRTAKRNVMRSKPIDASNRIEFVAPASSVIIGTAIELPLTLHEGTLKTVIVRQRQWDLSANSVQPIPDADELNPVIVKEGKQFIRVTPARLGEVELWIASAFTDNAMAIKTVSLHVIPSREQPTRFWFNGIPHTLSEADPPGVEYLSLQHPVGGNLAPVATYPDAKTELRIDDTAVQYSVRSNPSTGVIKFDPRSGSYLPIGLGHALITGNYAGATYRVCIVVGKTDIEWRRKESCSDIRK